jgi:hypothetical protein
MKRAIVMMVIAGATACGGPSRQQLAETPSAQAPRRPAEAPPASTSDEERTMAIDQFDDMETTQRAHREANQANRAGQGSAANNAKPVKTGPAIQAPPEPKKKGPAEQAPPGASP